MRILLVAPRFVGKKGEYYEFPLGMCYVSSVLRQAGHAVECLNLNHTDESAARAVARAMARHEAGAVCTGGLSPHYHMVKEVLEAARSARPDVVTVAGGGLISSEPELMVADLPLDYGVVGEGEVTAVKLFQALEEQGDISAVDGIAYRTGAGEVRMTTARTPIPDLDVLPAPDYEGFGVEEYLDLQRPADNYYMYPYDRPRLLPFISSRSCPFNCTFCYHPLGKRYRTRSIDSFFAEVQGYVDKYGLNMVGILDELFATAPERVEAFCSRLGRLDVKWIAQMRVDRVDRGVLRRMKEAGLFCISYGLESASDTVLASMRKHIKVAQIEEALATTREEGIGIQGNFLFGDPAETAETVNQTLAWWEGHPQYTINMNFVVPYPGSVLYDQSRGRGLIPDALEYIKSGCGEVNMTGFTEPELEDVKRRISELAAARRQYAEVVSVEPEGYDPAKDAWMYTFEATCPHCGATSVYRHYHIAHVMVFKNACRHCHQRYDLPPTMFPHIGDAVRAATERLRQLTSGGRPVSISPCLYPGTHFEYLKLMGIDPDELDLRHFFDNRPSKAGTLFLGKYPVLECTRETLFERSEGHLFLVLPCYAYERLVASFRDEFQVPEEDLVYVDVAWRPEGQAGEAGA